MFRDQTSPRVWGISPLLVGRKRQAPGAKRPKRTDTSPIQGGVGKGIRGPAEKCIEEADPLKTSIVASLSHLPQFIGTEKLS